MEMPFIRKKEIWKDGKTPFGFRCEVSQDKNFKSCSFHITNDKEQAEKWVELRKAIDEQYIKSKIYGRITEIDVDYCELCGKPIEEKEKICLRCEDLLQEAKEVQAEQYDKEEFGD